MTSIPAPRLAAYLLRRCLGDNEPLAGDVLEEFERRQSRRWLWSQVITALLFAMFRRPYELRPLHLVDERITPLVPRPSAPLPRRINANAGLVVTASPIHGAAVGMALVIVLAAIVMRPATWPYALLAATAVLLFGGLRILVTRRRSAAEARARTHVLMGR
jgi:hypothetical protein